MPSCAVQCEWYLQAQHEAHTIRAHPKHTPSAHPPPFCPQHVAEQDALVAAELNATSAMAAPPLGADALPDALRQWAVDASEIQYLRHPNGQPVEIGRGATAHVYKAMYRGEVVVSWCWDW